MPEVLALMRELGWNQEGRTFTSHDHEYAVLVYQHLGYWTLGKFTDGCYEHVEDGGTVAELKGALRLVPLHSLLHLTDQGLTSTFVLLAKAGWTPEMVRANLDSLNTLKRRM